MDDVGADPVLVIKSLLSTNTHERRNAEAQLAVLKKTHHGLSLVLASLISDLQSPVPLRQLCCVLLKQYVISHWSTNVEEFEAPLVADQLKSQLRLSLPQHLSDATRSIRTGVAYVVAAIAKFDWPELWPQLVDNLIQGLRTEPNAAHGCMRVLAELAQDLRPTQVEAVVPGLLPCLANVVLGQQSFSNGTRKRALEVLRTLAGSLFQANKHVAKALLFEWVEPLTECLLSGLEIAQTSNVQDLGMVSAVIKFLVFLVEKFSKQLAKMAPDRLVAVTVACLQQYAQLYSSTADADDGLDETTDSDGETISLDNLLYEICDLAQALSVQRHFDATLLPQLGEIFSCVLLLMQITDQKLQDWMETPSQFIADEDEDALTLDLRTASKDLLMNICEDHNVEAVCALCEACYRHLAQAAQKRVNGRADWWKQTEVVLSALAGQAELLTTVALEHRDQLPFSFPTFLTDHVFPALEVADAPILRAQSLWFLGRIVNILPAEWKDKLVDLCTILLAPEQSVLIRIAACRALYSVSSTLSEHNNLSVIEPKLKCIITNLVLLALCSDETAISLVLSTLGICVKANLAQAATMESRIIPLVNACALKYSGDPVVTAEACQLLRTMAGAPECGTKAEQRLIPTVVSVLEKDPDQHKLPLRLPAVCMELLEALIKGHGAPIGRSILEKAFPVVVASILRSEEPDLLAAGRECVRAYITVDAAQTTQWRSADGQTGSQLVTEVICHLLRPEAPSLTSSGMVCRLLYNLMKQAADAVRPFMDKLLHSILHKMASHQAPSVIQSMLVMIAYLINYDLEAVVACLANQQAPPLSTSTETALIYVLTEWVTQHSSLFGSHNQKISVLALSKLLETAVNKSDSILRTININRQPLSVCILHLLVGDMHRQAVAQARGRGDMDGNGSSGSATPRDVGPAGDAAMLPDLLSDVLAGVANDIDSDDWAEDDDDMSADSVLELDLNQYLTNFAKWLVAQPNAQNLIACLAPEERDRLAAVVV